MNYRWVLIVIPYLFCVSSSFRIIYPINEVVSHVQAEFGPEMNSTGIAGPIVVSPIFDACGDIKQSFKGYFLLAVRSAMTDATSPSCSYDEKVLNIQKSGALGAVIMHNDVRDEVNDRLISMAASTAAANEISIPSVFVTNASGKQLMSMIANDTVTLILNTEGEIRPGYIYDIILMSYVALFIVGWLSSTYYYSDSSIMRRMNAIKASYMKSLQPVAYSSSRLKKKDVEHGGMDATCAICLADYVPADTVIQLSCYHIFHEDCLTPWLREHSDLCPVCKVSVLKSMNTETDQLDVILRREILRQKCVYAFWRDIICLNIVFILLNPF